MHGLEPSVLNGMIDANECEHRAQAVIDRQISAENREALMEEMEPGTGWTYAHHIAEVEIRREIMGYDPESGHYRPELARQDTSQTRNQHVDGFGEF